MKNILNKIAAVLAFAIGGMAIFAGIQVLLGNDPGYYVINWLPVYNYTAGILTVFITAVLIWTNHRLALPVAIATISIHAAVMVILQTAYRDVVAPDSIQAMTVRLVVWAIILGLLAAGRRARRARPTNVPVA
ncbi:hypothetical protein FDZ74_10090 [bacterium]|nr:MAG: hypothetical protein FDZ74_10090 [bacterium]